MKLRYPGKTLVGRRRVNAGREEPLMGKAIRFGPLAPRLKVQLAGLDIPATMIRSMQRAADAIVTMQQEYLFDETEATLYRKKIIKKLEVSMRGKVVRKKSKEGNDAAKVG